MVNTNDASYIVASCKSWHYESYIQIKNNTTESWVWVSNPEELKRAVSETNPRYIFFVHWNWFVPESIFNKYQCVCFHMTDVPYGRGGSPLQNLISLGHTNTKLSALKMIEEMDAGPVYAKKTMSLAGTAQEIYARAGKLTFDLICWIIKEAPVPEEQVGRATYFKRRTPDQSEVAKNLSQNELYDFIRMLDAEGYPHAFIKHGNLKLELTNAKIKDDKTLASVKIILKDDNNEKQL